MLEHKCFNFSANAPSNTPSCTLLSHPQPRLIHLETNLHFISPNPISINIKVSTEKAASEANVPVCCALWPDEGTWVSHPLSLTRICNLRGLSSSPNIPIAHGDDQVTLWKPNGTAFPDIRRGKGEEITLWKAFHAMEKAIYYMYWQYLKAFGENNINSGKKSALTGTCFGCPLLGILLKGYVGVQTNQCWLGYLRYLASQPIFAVGGVQNVHQEYPCSWVFMSAPWRENYSGFRCAKYLYENSMSLIKFEVWFQLRTPPWEKAE